MDVNNERLLKVLIIGVYGTLAILFAIGIRLLTIDTNTLDPTLGIQITQIGTILIAIGLTFLFNVFLLVAIFFIKKRN